MPPVPSPLTRQENLRRVLRGEQPGWVPFAPNCCQWFQHQLAQNTLPAMLAGCTDDIDASIRMGIDIFTRNFDGGFRQRDTICKVERRTAETPLGTRRTVTYPTPHGALMSVWQEQRAITTSHCERYPVTTWEQDGAAFRWWLDQFELSWDPAPFVAVADRIGDHGLANLPLGTTPLKFLHNHFGLDGACIFIADHPDEAQAICDVWWAKLRPLIVQAAEHPRVECVILMDNIDTPFYPPRQVRRYWAPYVADAAAILRERGKHLFVHACGKLAQLSQVFAETGLTGLEGNSHAPLGDWDPARAVACHPRFVFMGGFTPMEQQLDGDALHRFYVDYLPKMPRQRVIFSTACNTEIRTPWERILQMRDLVRGWGGQPAM